MLGTGDRFDKRGDMFMASKIVDVKISEDLIPYLYTIKEGKTVGDKVTLSVVIGLFLSKTITLEKAAELSEKSIWDFMDVLKEQKIPWGEYSEEDFQMDDLAINKLAEGRYE